MNILFTPESKEKILNDGKTMTARCWLQNPPKVGDIVTASTGRKAETRFTKLRILKVSEWDGVNPPNPIPEIVSFNGRIAMEIAAKEGYESWNDFYDAYKALNAHHWDDPNRTHYFIEFEIAYDVIMSEFAEALNPDKTTIQEHADGNMSMTLENIKP